MRVIATRDDVHAGDDPPTREFEIPDGASGTEIIVAAADWSWLPSISGGKATWSVMSREPVAVLSQQSPEPKFFFALKDDDVWYFEDGILFLHFNYHAQIDPGIVYDVLRKVRWPTR
jgi:hypothetical protein